ncbi:serine/arginine repetitive matrix protein 3-like [Heterocephalus glaber]|uniref:Serine/arginine repetitive matrix protein 3-like n=1 Tax=Heterocephalus glaber TaxID=10181 RepID=A0AAX6SLF4_HETGA|nr:serine/arginine repetitive matrix protein 3-like [Heterocephalus glaber]
METRKLTLRSKSREDSAWAPRSVVLAAGAGRPGPPPAPGPGLGGQTHGPASVSASRCEPLRETGRAEAACAPVPTLSPAQRALGTPAQRSPGSRRAQGGAAAVGRAEPSPNRAEAFAPRHLPTGPAEEGPVRPGLTDRKAAQSRVSSRPPSPSAAQGPGPLRTPGGSGRRAARSSLGSLQRCLGPRPGGEARRQHSKATPGGAQGRGTSAPPCPGAGDWESGALGHLREAARPGPARPPGMDARGSAVCKAPSRAALPKVQAGGARRRSPGQRDMEAVRTAQLTTLRNRTPELLERGEDDC